MRLSDGGVASEAGSEAVLVTSNTEFFAVLPPHEGQSRKRKHMSVSSLTDKVRLLWTSDGTMWPPPRSDRSLLQRGGSLVRRSLRKIHQIKKKSSTTNSDSLKFNEGSSLDSGLGEDSDEATPPTATTPIPILRVPSSQSNRSKKHVMIREPSLRHLPSAQKRQSVQKICVSTSASQTQQHPDAAPTSSVASQWTSICETAALEVKRQVPECTSEFLNLIFHNNNENEKKLENLHQDQISNLFENLHKVLHMDIVAIPTISAVAGSVILHRVQKLLVQVTQVCPELDATMKRELEKALRLLIKECEENRFRDLQQCFTQTQRIYLKLWCALIDVHCSQHNFN